MDIEGDEDGSSSTAAGGTGGSTSQGSSRSSTGVSFFSPFIIFSKSF